jgi:hypothetical protein
MSLGIASASFVGPEIELVRERTAAVAAVDGAVAPAGANTGSAPSASPANAT